MGRRNQTSKQNNVFFLNTIKGSFVLQESQLGFLYGKHNGCYDGNCYDDSCCDNYDDYCYHDGIGVRVSNGYWCGVINNVHGDQHDCYCLGCYDGYDYYPDSGLNDVDNNHCLDYCCLLML